MVPRIKCPASMYSAENSNVPGRVILELLSSQGQTMCKEELQNIKLKVTQLITEKENAAATKSTYAIQGNQLYCPKEMVSPRGTLRDSRFSNTPNAGQAYGNASSSSVPVLPERKAPPPQKKAKDAAKPVAFVEEKHPPDPNELIRFPDGYDAPRWWTGTGQAYFDDSRWH